MSNNLNQTTDQTADNSNNKALILIQYYNNAAKLKEILPNNSHFIQKSSELQKTITNIGFEIDQVNIQMDAIVHESSTVRYISKIQFHGKSIPSFNQQLESDHYIDIVIANMNDAIQFLRDQKERLKSKVKI
jgi:hypothetical protein